jgi:hypothetical protein
MIPKKLALGLRPEGGNRFSEKIMLNKDVIPTNGCRIRSRA